MTKTNDTSDKQELKSYGSNIVKNIEDKLNNPESYQMGKGKVKLNIPTVDLPKEE